jgi:anti-sigma-K factor RskA
MSEDLIGTGDKDTLAAEYVLGTLDSDERSAAKILLTQDEGFAAKVKVWERRFGELHLMVEPVEPEPDIWQRIKVKLPGVQPDPVIALPHIGPELDFKPEPAQAPELALDWPAERNPEPESKPDFRIEELEPKPWLADPLPEPEPGMIVTENAPASPDASPLSPDGIGSQSLQDALDEIQVAVAEQAAATKTPPVGAAVEPAADAVAPLPAPSAVPIAPPASMAQRDQKQLQVMRRRLVRWRSVAVLMTLAVAAVATLLALWKFAPERVPPPLRPLALMRMVGVTIEAASAPRTPAPPESQFDE